MSDELENRLWQKKPVVIEADRYWKNAYDAIDHDGFEVVCYCDDGRGAHPRADAQHVHTLEGPLHISDGDWIIKGVQGEFYPCKPEIFEATYEAVRDWNETYAATQFLHVFEPSLRDAND